MAPVQETDDNTTCPEGASKRFECQVIGLPRPSVRWYKDGVNITTNSRYKFEYTPDGYVVLVLEKVTADDQGVYLCRAQNSEGSAETAAQLYIKGTVSAGDESTSSVHAMASFKKIEIEEEMTSQSQRRPLVIGNSCTIDNNVGNEDSFEKTDVANNIKEAKELGDSVEKGIREIEQQHSRKETKKKHIGDGMDIACSESDEETQKNDELASMVDDLLELTQFGNSGRRLTTDSGVTSRGSSFSSEPDISITEESMKEMKEYLHGKADALYQPFEHGKLKDIKESDVKIIVAQSEKLTKKERAAHATKQVMSMTSLRKEKYDLDRVNELEASVLAGMYLFDKGPSDKVDEHRHGIPALELLVRKEALENISDRETSKSNLEELDTEKLQLKVEYQTAEIIRETESVNSVEVEKLNAINIERNNEIVRKQEENRFIKAKTVSCIEVEEGESAIRSKTDTNTGILQTNGNDLIPSKTESLNQVTELSKTESQEEEEVFRIRKYDKATTGNGTDEGRIDIDAATSGDTIEEKVQNGKFSSSQELDSDSKTNNDMKFNVSGENGKLNNTRKEQHLRDTNIQGKPEQVLDTSETILKDDNSGSGEKFKVETGGNLDECQDRVETNDYSILSGKDNMKLNEDASLKNEDTKTKQHFKDNDDQSKSEKSLDKFETNLKDNNSGVREKCIVETGTYLDDGQGKVQTTDDGKLLDNNANANVTDIIRSKADEKIGSSFDEIEILQLSDSYEIMSGLKNGSEGALESGSKSAQINALGQDININEDSVKSENSLINKDEKGSQMRFDDSSRPPDNAENGRNESLVETVKPSENLPKHEQSKDVSEKHVQENVSDIKQKPNEEIPRSTPTEKGRNKIDKKEGEDADFETQLAEEKSKIGREYELKKNDSTDARNRESLNEMEVYTEKETTGTSMKTTNENKVRLSDSAKIIDLSAHDKIKEDHKDVTEASSTEKSASMGKDTELLIHGETVTKSQKEISVDEVDIVIESVAKEKLTLDEISKVKGDLLETSANKNSEGVDDAVASLQKDSRTQSENLKQFDEKKEHVIMLYSADENSDAGRHFTEPLKDKDLVYMDDTVAEIPNIINIINNMKENEIRKKDASLTEEIVNKTASVNKISENSSMVASVNETQATNGLMVQSVDEINLVPLENEPSHVENSPLIKHAETVTRVSKRVTEETNASIESAVESHAVKIADRNETTGDLESEVSEKQLLQKKAKTDTKDQDQDKTLALDTDTKEKVKKVQQEVCEEKLFQEEAKAKSEGPDIDSLCNVEAKDKLNKTPKTEMVEELIVPEHATKDEDIPDLKIIERKENYMSRQEDASDLDKSKMLAGEDSKPNVDQKKFSTEDAQKEQDIPATDTKLEHDEGTMAVVALLNDTNVQVPDGFPVKLQWKISGVELSKVSICKNGRKVKIGGNLHADIVGNVCSLTADKVTFEDEATYSIRIHNSEKDHGETTVKVTTTEGKQNQGEFDVEVNTAEGKQEQGEFGVEVTTSEEKHDQVDTGVEVTSAEGKQEQGEFGVEVTTSEEKHDQVDTGVEVTTAVGKQEQGEFSVEVTTAKGKQEQGEFGIEVTTTEGKQDQGDVGVEVTTAKGKQEQGEIGVEVTTAKGKQEQGEIGVEVTTAKGKQEQGEFGVEVTTAKGKQEQGEIGVEVTTAKGKQEQGEFGVEVTTAKGKQEQGKIGVEVTTAKGKQEQGKIGVEVSTTEGKQNQGDIGVEVTSTEGKQDQGKIDVEVTKTGGKQDQGKIAVEVTTAEGKHDQGEIAVEVTTTKGKQEQGKICVEVAATEEKRDQGKIAGEVTTAEGKQEQGEICMEVATTEEKRDQGEIGVEVTTAKGKQDQGEIGVKVTTNKGKQGQTKIGVDVTTTKGKQDQGDIGVKVTTSEGKQDQGEIGAKVTTTKVKEHQGEVGVDFTTTEAKLDQGKISIEVTTTEDKQSTQPEEPQFTVEPVVDVKDGRRLSIKCSVTGFPAPNVTWYHHGQQLDPNALWDIYSKDGYHYLTVGDPSVLDSEEIVCRVENHLGYVQRVVTVKRDGDEVYCEPVLPPVSPEAVEDKEFSPRIEISISEIVTANLRKLPLACDYTDGLNFVTLSAGDVVEILACETEETVLARNMQQKEKVCYIPKQALAVGHDVSSQVCENAAVKNNIELSEQQLQDNKEEAAMPERRKMKSPSPKMTSTPKTKRKEMDTESTEELQKRLGYSDNGGQRKEFSTPDSVEFTEYNDGTTRPMFKKRLKSVTAKSGEMAQLECTVSGSPLPKILWLKNNRPLKASDGCKVIVDEGTNILVFPQAKDEDVGIYTARAMNVNGSIMCSAEFTLSDGSGLPAQPVTDSPMDMDFTTPAYFFQMSSCEVSEGRLARFDCRVVAYPKPEIVWMRDGKVVDAEQRFKLLNFNNEIYSLLIQDVRTEDTGRYTCWARNKFGEAMTEAYLNVLALADQEPEGDIAPKFLTRFYDQQTTEGTASDFKCLIAGRPEPSVTWLLDDLEIREDKGVRMRHKDGMVSLEIKSPRVDQSGTYTCQLSNPLGEATCSAMLTVVEDKLHGKMLPKFLKKFDHVTVKEGEEAKFTSVIIGEPRPDVMWLFDHKPISDTNRRFMMKKEGDAYTLIIKNVRFEDGGKITCKASNEEGEVYCSANLHVRESKYMRDLPEKTGVKGQDDIDAKFGYIPTFTKRLQDLEVKEGSRATFECRVMGIPDPEISWMKDGRVITPGGRYHMTFEGGAGQLVIDNVTGADTGVYTCIVSNSQGKSSSTAALKLEEPKKERYTPDRLLEERTSRKERYTPDKYLLDDSTVAKRPYLDTDRYDAKVRKSYESPITTTKLEDTYLPRPKKKYDSPKSSYDSFKPRYDTSYESPMRSYESPITPYDSAFNRLESPVRQYDTYKRYESPVRQYESVSTKYESPVRPYESISTRYESPIRQIDSGYTRYESPVRMYDTPRTLYESPRRRSSVGREEKIKAVPKIPFDRPALLNKHDDSVQLSWLPAPTYSLPDDARHVSYIIESREVPSRDWTKVAASVPGTSYTVRHLRPDREYEFRVRAQNQHGVSEPTWNATFDKRVDETSKKLDLPEMRAPPRLPTHRPIITDLGEETMRLAWRPVETYQARRTPPVSYRLEAKELPGKDWMPLSSRLRDTTHYLSELPHDRDYMIRVRAENDFGISEPTEPLWIPRATAFPGVPITRPEIIDYEDTRAKLSWSRVDIPAFGLDDTPLLYMLEVEEPPHKDWRTIARDLDDTEYIVEGLKPGHDYRFRVRAKTPTGIVSEPSPAVSLYTKMAQTRAPVDRLEILDYEPDFRSVNLSWDRVNIPPYNIDEEPLMYMLEYQEPPLPEWKTLITGIPTTRYRVRHLDTDRDYNFRVRALTPYGVSPPSPALPVTMRQTPVTRGLPEKVVISEVDAHSLRLTWRRPMYDLDKPVNYQVEMLESPFTDWRPIATRVMETTYKVTGLKPTKDYQFRVIPHVDTEYLAPTPSAALTTMPVKPRLPYAEPRLKELTPESVQLSWGSAELPAYQRKRSPIHYKVEMAELPSSNWVPVTRKVMDTSYTVTGLRPNQEYKFRVFAESDSGLSEPSMPTTLYRRPTPRFPLTEPTIRDLSQNIVHLAWSPAELPGSAEGVSYMVEMQTPPGIASWNALYRQHPTPSVRLADLRPDLDYLVRVRAQSGTYLSEPTLPVYIPRRAAPPRLPVEEPYAVEINPDFVKLQWRSADLPTHIQDYAHVTYRLEAQELPDTSWVPIARGISHTDFKVTGLNPQRDYNFRVRAENEYGLSDPTHPMMIRKRAVAPVLPSYEPMLYDIGAGSARLSWRPATLPSFMPSTSPITYTLFVQDLPFKTWRPLVKGIPHTSYYVSGLQPDKEYLFRVQAENQYGSSKPTDAVRLPRFKDYTRPISVPEVSDFDEDLTSVKLRWMPTRASPPFDATPRKYTIETWEPVRREWKSVARGVPDTTYQIRGLPKLPDHLFRVRMDTEEPTLSEPSMPVSLSRYSLPRAPMYKPQLYELEDESVRLSWQPVHVPEGVSRRSVRYIIEQREIPETTWSPVATDIMETSYKVRGLRPKCDYEFRVKARYEGISTEPSYPVSLFRRAVIPKVRLDAPEVYDVDDTSLSLRWNTVDVPAFTPDEEPLLFVIERQTLPSYEWQPVATNVTDKSYTVKDLEPYQDYNFRVRGVYPSGFTEPSPYVPVYRRPSESKIGLVGLESSTLDFKSYSSQKYSSKISPTQTLPTKSLHATLPSELSPITKKAVETRLRSYTGSPQRRYSVANIYDTRELYEADFKKLPAPVPEPKFKLENAYVYKRSRSPVKTDLPTFYDTVKAGGYKKATPKKENDLYAWYQQHRRYSDAGFEELSRRRSRKSLFIEEKILEDHRAELALESQQRRLLRRGSLPSVTTTPRVARPTQPSVTYPSVADRYEDIKCPYIVTPGHWKFARRHSVALDWDDLQKLQQQLQIQSKKLETKRRTKSEMPKTYKPKYDFISQTQDEYFGGTYFHIEDQLNFNDMRPRIPRVDLTSPYIRRSLSQERDPGYFMLSKFTLSIAGVRKPRPASNVSATRVHGEYVRPASLEPSPVARLPREYRSYTPKYRSYTPDYSTYTPEYRPFTPDYRSYTPEYRPFTPDYRSYTPDYRSYTPDYRSYTPDYRSYTPEYRSQTPAHRSYSPDQKSLLKTRSLTPDLYYEYKSRSQTPDYHDIERSKHRSASLAQELARSRLQGSGYKPTPRASTERSVRQVSPGKPARRPSPPRQKEAFVKQRSYSISVPRAEVKKFNRIVEDSKSLITNYERLDQRSRQSSVADIRSDPRFTLTPRGSMASLQADVYSDSGYSTTPRGSFSVPHGEVLTDPRYTSTPRGSMSAPHADVKSDPRYSRSRRSSVTMTPAERERLASISSIKADARFSSQRRATIATNEDLKSKLDTMSSKLVVPKPKKKKSSRPTIKYKSSRGEGAV